MAQSIQHSTEERKFPRLTQSIPVKLKLDRATQEYAIVSRNISEGGMFIEIPRLTEGALLNSSYPKRSLSLKIGLPSDAEQVVAEARVIWVKKEENALREGGIGVKFIRISEDNRRAIALCVTEGLKAEKPKARTFTPLKKTDLVPRKKGEEYNKDFAEQRLRWLGKKTKADFAHISHYSINPEDIKGNIENFVGVAQVPIGIVGPLKVNGEFAKDSFYVPFATTEGAVVATYQRGALAITKSGGANTAIHKDENNVSPVFLLKGVNEARDFTLWIERNFARIKEEAEKTTRYGKLLKITPYPIGRRVILNFSYFTADAMGANMINVATEEACKFIFKETKPEEYFLRSNLSSEKKASFFNFITGYGKTVSVDCLLPRNIVRGFLGASPEEICNFWHSCILGGYQAGMLGFNAHNANALAAIFVACGQDLAHIVNAASGITVFEVTGAGDLYTALKLPNIIVGTVGGGSALGTQRECLDIIGCYGEGKAKKFAEIIAASLLAGEIALSAAVASHKFLQPHKRSREHIKRKISQDQKDK